MIRVLTFLLLILPTLAVAADPTPPIFGARRPKDGTIQLNPAWSEPVKELLQSATAIKVSDPASKEVVHHELGEKCRGEKALRLLGPVIAIVGDGNIFIDKSDGQSVFNIKTDAENVAVAKKLLPRVMDSLQNPKDDVRPQLSLTDQLQGRWLLARIEPEDKQAEQGLNLDISGDEMAYSRAFLDHGKKYRGRFTIDANFDPPRIRVTPLNGESQHGLLWLHAQPDSLANAFGIVIAAKGDEFPQSIEQSPDVVRVTYKRDEKDSKWMLHQVRELREIAVENLLSDQVQLYPTARRFFDWSMSSEQEADLRQQAEAAYANSIELNNLLRHEDSDNFRIKDMERRVIAARLAGNHTLADDLKRQADELRSGLNARYPNSESATDLTATDSNEANASSAARSQKKPILLQHATAAEVTEVLKDLELLGDQLSVTSPGENLLILIGHPGVFSEAMEIIEAIDVASIKAGDRSRSSDVSADLPSESRVQPPAVMLKLFVDEQQRLEKQIGENKTDIDHPDVQDQLAIASARYRLYGEPKPAKQVTDWAGVIARQRVRYEQAEREAAKFASEYSSTTGSNPNDEVKRSQLEFDIKSRVNAAFGTRMVLQLLQLEKAHQDLSLAQQRLRRRHLLAEKVVQRRVEELLSGEDLSWLSIKLPFGQEHEEGSAFQLTRPPPRLKNLSRITGGELDVVCSVVVSPDGTHLYAAARDAHKLLVFGRQTAGTLTTPMQTVNSEDDLEGVLGLRITPDGKYVVTTSLISRTVTLFARDPESGRLTRKDVARDNQDDVIGLHWAFDCEVSPDSRFVYVTNSLTLRDASDLPSVGAGHVTSFQIVDDRLEFLEVQTGRNACFDGAVHIAIHPSGKWLYVANYRSGAIVVIARDIKSGRMRLQQIVRDNDLLSLDGVFSVRCSPDGKHLYASSVRFNGESGLTAFRIKPEDDSELSSIDSGSLTPVQVHRGSMAELAGLEGGNRILVGPDGHFVYLSATLSGSLLSFRRDRDTGRLSDPETVRVTPDDDALGPASIDVSPDGRFIYAAAQDHESVLILEHDRPTQAAAPSR